MIHPDTELQFINSTIGYGVFATKSIPQGTITWTLDPLDRQFDESFFNALPLIQQEKLRKYILKDNENKYTLCWDWGRFVNHSFNPSCTYTIYNISIAIRDIEKGEELTEDYRNYGQDFDFECWAEPDRESRKIKSKDILQIYQESDRKIAEALKNFERVKQPLACLLAPDLLNTITAIAQGREKLVSSVNILGD
jgi:uncharacterized protein